VATGILLSVSPVLFSTPWNFLVLPGTLIVFVSSWMYMDNPPPKESAVSASTGKGGPSIFRRLFGPAVKPNKWTLCGCTLLTVAAVALLTVFESKMPGRPAVPQDNVVISPFENTLAMIRCDAPRGDRVELVKKYEPFFDTVHYSIPDYLPGEPEGFHNLTHDQFPSGNYDYIQVARTMNLVLELSPELGGLFFFQHEAWVDPLAWQGMDPQMIHFASAGEPPFRCMKDTSKFSWYGWEAGYHRQALSALEAVKGLGRDYHIGAEEFCIGSSDLYYIPRRFFADFVFLSHVFGELQVHHQLAVPTMIHIIDQTRRVNPYRSSVDRIGDCWDSENVDSETVLEFRCGHKLDYHDSSTTLAFYSKLEQEASALGKPFEQAEPSMSHPQRRALMWTELSVFS
jgi:hypothetical protein